MLTPGAVASRLIVTNWLAVPPALVAVQVRVTPLVSLLRVLGSQPDCALIADSLSTALQLTATSLTYQPLLPRVPFTWGVMTGGVVSHRSCTGLPPTGPSNSPQARMIVP